MPELQASMSVADFLEQVAVSELLSSEQMSALRQKASSFSGTALDLGARLVQGEHLTAYQVKHLLAGRAMGFFLGKYKILDPLGQGGMGFVLRAEDTETAGPVALKLLPHEATRDPERVARFHREARAAMKLDHPNIVQTFELGQEGQLHYIAMELVEGVSLKELIARDGRLDPASAVSIVSQIARALECAALQGIIHRDIKPSNIAVTPAGHAKLLDLGLARVSDTLGAETSLVRTLTRTGHMLGTIDYVAPEQAEDPRAADARSDIYSLGCTLYQCLTGHVPFPEGTFVQKLLKHREDEAVRPIQLVPDLDPELSRVVERMMAKRPEDRFPTAAAVVEALAGFSDSPQPDRVPVADETASGARDESVESANPAAAASSSGLEGVLRSIAEAEDVSPLDNLLLMRKRRRWSPKKTVACVAVVIGWLLVAGYWSWSVGGQGTVVISLSETPDSDIEIQLDDRGIEIEEIGGQEFEVSTGSHRITVSSSGYKKRTVSFKLKRDQWRQLEIVLEPTVETLRRRELTGLLAALENGLGRGAETESFLDARDGLRAFQLKFHGTNEATGAEEKLARLPAPIDALKREQISEESLATAGIQLPQRLPKSVVAVLGNNRLKHWTPVLGVAVSPDGRYVASSDWCELRLHEIESGRLLRSFPHVSRVAAVDFNSDGTRLVSVDQNRHVWVWDSRTGKNLAYFRGMRGMAWGVCFSPDGSMLAVAEQEQTVTLWDLNSKKSIGELTGHGGKVASVAFDDRGALLASADSDGDVSIWDVATRARRHRLTAHKGGASAVAFSPGSKTLVSCGNDGTVKLWDVASGSQRITMRGHAGSVNSVCFGSDQNTVYSAGRDRTIRIWNAQTGKEQRKPLSQAGEITSMAYSHDGRRLVTGSSDCSIAVWDMASYSRLHSSAEHDSRVRCLDISRSGLHLATGGADGRILIWDLGRRSIVRSLDAHSNYVTGVEFSRDGKTLMSVSTDRTTKIWDLPSGTVRHNLTGDHMVTSLAMETGRRNLAVGDSKGMIRFWDVGQGTRVRELDCGDPSIGSIQFSLDGKTLVVLSRYFDKLTLWEVLSGRKLTSLEGDSSPFYSQAFSPDGSTLWAITGEGTIKSWRTSDWKSNWQVKTSSRYVNNLAVSPDGQKLCTVSYDGFLKLWSADKGKQIGELKMAPNRCFVDQAAFSSDGRHLLTANGNGTVYVFRLPLESDE